MQKFARSKQKQTKLFMNCDRHSGGVKRSKLGKSRAIKTFKSQQEKSYTGAIWMILSALGSANTAC